jgi:hypothetical protein
MDVKDKVEILSRGYVIEILRAIHKGYNEAGRCCNKDKELRTQFSFLSYHNYRRIMKVLLQNNFILRCGDIVRRTYKLNYDMINVNIFED